MFHAELFRTFLLVGIALASSVLAHLPLEKRTGCTRYTGSISVVNTNNYQIGRLNRAQGPGGTAAQSGQFRVNATNSGEANLGTFSYIDCAAGYVHLYCNGCGSNGYDSVLGIDYIAESGLPLWFPVALDDIIPGSEMFRRDDPDQSSLWQIENNILTPLYGGQPLAQPLWAHYQAFLAWDLWWGIDYWETSPTQVYMQFVPTSDPVALLPPADSSSFLCTAS